MLIVHVTISFQLDFSVLFFYSSVDVPLAEGPVNLNWSQIMKTINDSPFEFFKEGGWGFLVPDDNGENAVSGYFRFRPMYCATKLTGMVCSS